MCGVLVPQRNNIVSLHFLPQRNVVWCGVLPQRNNVVSLCIIPFTAHLIPATLPKGIVQCGLLNHKSSVTNTQSCTDAHHHQPPPTPTANEERPPRSSLLQISSEHHQGYELRQHAQSMPTTDAHRQHPPCKISSTPLVSDTPSQRPPPTRTTNAHR